MIGLHMRGSQPWQREYSPTPRQALQALHDSKIESRDYLEIFSRLQVVRDLLGMLATIDLDYNFGLRAEEIHDVGSQGPVDVET